MPYGVTLQQTCCNGSSAGEIPLCEQLAVYQLQAGEKRQQPPSQVQLPRRFVLEPSFTNLTVGGMAYAFAPADASRWAFKTGWTPAPLSAAMAAPQRYSGLERRTGNGS